jgi:hypothetical protein
MPPGIPKVVSELVEIFEATDSEDPEAGALEPDMFEMRSAAEEHQRQCHKVQDGVWFLLLPVYLYWPEHIVSCLH